MQASSDQRQVDSALKKWLPLQDCSPVPGKEARRKGFDIPGPREFSTRLELAAEVSTDEQTRPEARILCPTRHPTQDETRLQIRRPVDGLLHQTDRTQNTLDQGSASHKLLLETVSMDTGPTPQEVNAKWQTQRPGVLPYSEP